MTSQIVTIQRIHQETPEIKTFELLPDGGQLIEFSPGAHIDVHLPGGLMRQYSLWNGPSDRDAYRIGVKREAKGRGGSAAMHELCEGDRLEVSFPRNHFELQDSDGPAILLAGGIGITPILAMARHLAAEGRPHVLHLFARDTTFAPFLSQLTRLPEAPVHLGLIPPTLVKVIAGILAQPDSTAHLYLCGPGPFMDIVEQQAAIAGWARDRVHMERFSASPESLNLTGDGFEVVLQRSGRTIAVAVGETIIEAMAAAGITPLTSCEQGVCGTCMTTVLEGTPDHRDQYLNAAEKASGTLIMPCVSRCKGKRLVLDL